MSGTVNVGVKVLEETRGDDRFSEFEPKMVLYVNDWIDGERIERVLAVLDFNGAENLRDSLDYHVNQENEAFVRKYGHIDMMENEVL